MTTTVNVHDPLTWAAEIIADPRGGYVVLRGTGPGTALNLICRSRGGLDGLIHAAEDAKTLLPDDTPGGAS